MDSNHTCLAVIILDSALKKDESYYLQVFWKECKYIEKKLIKYINDNLSDFSSSDESHEEEIRISSFLKNIGHYFSNGECTQKKRVVFFKLCLQCIEIQKTIY